MKRRLKLVWSAADTPLGTTGGRTVIDQFDDHQAMRGFSPRTRKRRRWTLTKFSESADLSTATRDDVEAFIAQREAPASRRALLSDLSQFFEWAIDRGLIESNPTKGVGSVKVPTRHARPLTQHDLQRTINEAKAPRLRVAVMLAAYSGLRVSEIAALRWDDVSRGMIHVRSGKGDKDRSVRLARELADALAELGRRDDGYVIGTSGANVSQRVRYHFRRLGIERRPHDLRATFGTAVYERHGIQAAQQALGHTSIATTQAYLGLTALPPGALDGLHGDAA